MTTKNVWKEPVYFALLVGVVLSAFSSLSMLTEFDLSIWLWIHNSIVVITLALAFLIGYRLRAKAKPIVFIVIMVSVFYAIVMFLYVGSYAAVTFFIPDRLAWIPFFHRDYTYWGFRSVRAYLDHKSNFQDLLVLQIISCLICSIMYLVSGLAGSFAQTMRSRSTAA